MVSHVVIFTWIEGVTPAQVAAFSEALSALADKLPHLATIIHGPDLAFRKGNGDYALVATFADKESWVAYQSHPLHTAFVADFVAPLQASRLTIQF